MEVNDLLVLETDKLKEALELLNKNGLGTLFVTDQQRIIKGIVTDGDIRRALLRNSSLDQLVSSVMNTAFTSLHYQTDNAKILETLNTRIRIIPMLDDQGKVVDYASINHLRKITVASPLLNGNELAYVTDCIKTNWISSQGKYVRKFEEMFSEHHEGMKALAVSNGTVALHLALDALGIGKGDEVIVPDLTFAASINSILYTGATPVIADIDKETWTLDPDRLEKHITPKTKAIMPVHLYGHPCDMDPIMELAKKYNLKIVEDSAEALGSYYKGRPVGVFSDASTYSFFGNKTITTGEGGMVIFKDPAVAERASILRDHGMQKNRRYWHQEVGYNYRMTNLQAAIGVAQFERLTEFVTAKQRNAAVYSETLKEIPYFILPAVKEWSVNSFWLYTFLVKEDAPFTRDELMDFLTSKGIESRPVFFGLHEMPPYVAFGKAEELTVSKRTSVCGMSLPSSVNLSQPELLHICNSINEFSKLRG